jgi:hypothetical protein
MSAQTNLDDSIEMYGGSVSRASATVIDKSKGFFVAAFISLNLIATVFMFVQWKIAEREARLLEYYIMELDGKLMASGIVKPPESWSGHKGDRK